MTLGIPYARQERLNEFDAAVCPKCGIWIILKQRKDFESFTGIEYRKHYIKVHEEGKKK